MSVIVIGFVTLDGFMSDPVGSEGTPDGGWAVRHGRETIDGDKFQLGSVLDEGVMLFGRRTWEIFAKLWPSRKGRYADRMNATPRLIASRTLTTESAASAWAGSSVVDGDPIEAVKRERRDVIIPGSLSVVHALMAADLIDEYRLLTFPTFLGSGERLFPEGRPPAYLECLTAEQSGAAVFGRYGRPSCG